MKKKKLKSRAKKPENTSQENDKEDKNKPDFGGMQIPDLKKNLGCG
jgi:hypothetical protein